MIEEFFYTPAFQKGWECYKTNGLKICPYPDGSKDKILWVFGYYFTWKW